MTEVLIKRLSKNIELPKYETNGSSGMDLSANIEKQIKIEPGKTSIIPTGISVSIPENFEIQIRSRSGLAAKSQVSVLNSPGTIDADYRGELKVILINLSNKTFVVEKGTRIAQMVLCPIVPTPDAAKYVKSGQPKPPIPIINTLALSIFFCPATPTFLRIICFSNLLKSFNPNCINYFNPVDPKPPSPLIVSSKLSTSLSLALTIGHNTI